MQRFNFPPPARQIYVQAFLDRVRQTGLHEALRLAVSNVDAATLRKEITVHVPTSGLQAIQGTGVRDEEVFATPGVLRAAPGVLAYYRLMLGISQKAFYTPKSGLNIFKAMEEKQVVRDATDPHIEDLCTEMNEVMSVLLHSLPQATLQRDVRELPLLMLGAQADGSWRGQIGGKATKGVFDSMKSIVKGQGKKFVETDTSITVTNSAGRDVSLALAADPDVVIRERVNGQDVYKVAIEIKGGSDYANLHNRVGEAEKSHQKARGAGAQDLWTIIMLSNADMARLKQESPTTRQWLDTNQVINRKGPDWNQLKTLTLSAMGI